MADYTHAEIVAAVRTLSKAAAEAGRQLGEVGVRVCQAMGDAVGGPENLRLLADAYGREQERRDPGASS